MKPKNTGVGGLSLLQGVFPTQEEGIEPGSPALQVDSLPAEPSGKPIWVESYSICLCVCVMAFFHLV